MSKQAQATVLLITASYDQTIRFWEASTGSCQKSNPYTDSVWIFFSSDFNLIYKYSQFLILFSLLLFQQQVNRIAISHDKSLLAVAGNPVAKIFDLKAMSSNAVWFLFYFFHCVYFFMHIFFPYCKPIVYPHKTNVTAIGFFKESKWLFTGSEDRTVKVWDLRFFLHLFLFSFFFSLFF